MHRNVLVRSAASKLGDFAPRSGFFFVSRPGDVHVCKWDPATETLLQACDLNPDDVARIIAGELLDCTGPAFVLKFETPLFLGNLGCKVRLFSLRIKACSCIFVRFCRDFSYCVPVMFLIFRHALRLCAATQRKEFDSGLGPYPLKTLPLWQNLTRYITQDVLCALLATDSTVASTAAVLAADGPAASPAPASVVPELAAAAKSLDASAADESTVRFTKLRGCGHGALPSDVTQFAMDPTFALVDALDRYGYSREGCMKRRVIVV